MLPVEMAFRQKPKISRFFFRWKRAKFREKKSRNTGSGQLPGDASIEIQVTKGLWSSKISLGVDYWKQVHSKQ
jgi:hypothetical protein